MRQIKEVIATPQVSTTSTSPVSLSGGPSISVSHGGALLVLFSARIHRTSDMSAVYAGPQINGKPKGAVNTSTAIASAVTGEVTRHGGHILWYDLGPDTDTIEMKYWVNSAGTTGVYAERVITVLPL